MDIEVCYRVVTPLFCAGAHPNHPELRLSAFKGVLRYWWRAFAWARCTANLDQILQEEEAIFGSARKGQSRLHLSLVVDSGKMKVRKVGEALQIPGPAQPVGQGACYLGYGVMSVRHRLTRGCILAPFDFTVRMRGRNLTQQQVATLRDALIAMGTLGGIGAKSRKGYGSLVILTLKVNGDSQWDKPKNICDLTKAVARFRGTYNATLAAPEFTALSSNTRHVLLASNEEQPLKLLDLIGRELVRFRSWGHNGMILGNEPREGLFENDHDLMKGNVRTTHPLRIAFGLPHNYGQRPKDRVSPSRFDRRASPLFIHIHECDGRPVAVLSFVPARFLPTGKSCISVGGKSVPLGPRLYDPIHCFLDRLLDPTKRREPFTNAIGVPR